MSSSRPPPPVLPEPLHVVLEGKCVIEYIDIKSKHTSSSASLPTIVLVHGSPGTYRDFRYLIPLLQDKARVVGINLPGFGGSNVLDEADYYEHVSALGAATLAYQALTQICEGEENVFLLGHSVGGHAAINLASFAAEDSQLKVRGIVLLASAGHRPHRAIWPVTCAVLATAVRAEIPIVSWTAETATQFAFTKVVGLPSNAPRSHYVSALIRSHYTDYDLLTTQIKELAQHTPAFVVWAKDDALIEEEISQKLSQECHPGPRFVFETGGHNIQKTHASVLAKEIAAWVQEIASTDNRAKL